MSRKIGMVVVALLGLPALARAHDLWLERDGTALVLRYGHRGGEALPVEAAKVKAVRCVRGGAARDLRAAASVAPTALRFPAECDAASAFLDGGFWSLTPDGEVNAARDATPSSVKAWASRQYAKWVDVRTPAARAPLGDELEIVPVTELSKVHAGDKMTVRVLLEGKPVAGAVVAIDHRPLGETDSAGEARVKVRGAGVESVDVSLRRPLATPQADALVLEASLTFEVAR